MQGREDEMDERRLVVDADGVMVFARLEDVTYIRAEDHYVKICFPESFIRARGPLGRIERRLSESGFVRIHRSYLVSLRHIKRIGYGCVILDDRRGTVLPLGVSYERRLYDEIKKQENIFL